MLSSLREKQRRKVVFSEPITMAQSNDLDELPDGWEERFSKNNIPFYYYYPLKFCQWHFPTASDLQDPDAAKTRAIEKEKTRGRNKKQRKKSPIIPSPKQTEIREGDDDATDDDNLMNSRSTAESREEVDSSAPEKSDGMATSNTSNLSSATKPSDSSTTSTENREDAALTEVEQTTAVATQSEQEDSTAVTDQNQVGQATEDTNQKQVTKPSATESTKNADDNTLKPQSIVENTRTSPPNMNVEALVACLQNKGAFDHLPTLPTIDFWEVLALGHVKGVHADGTTIVTTAPLASMPKENVVVTDEGGNKYQLLRHSSERKRKRTAKRHVGSASKSVKQMKDATVRGQATSLAFRASMLQSMTVYESASQKNNNPSSNTIVLNRDEIVCRPDKEKEGNRNRKSACWNVLIPPGMDTHDLTQQLEELTKALKSKSRSPVDLNISSNPAQYLDGLYGDGAGETLLNKFAEKEKLPATKEAKDERNNLKFSNMEEI